MLQVLKKLKDLWLHYLELSPMLGDFHGSKQLLRLTVIASQTSHESKLAIKCINCTDINLSHIFCWKLSDDNWYNTEHFQTAKMKHQYSYH